MTGQLNSEVAEQLRAERYRKAVEALTEIEQKELNEIFLTLGDVANRVATGDRSSMLQLLAITASSLRLFNALTQETREALANGLEKMSENLGEAKGFLPRGRGERSRRDKSAHHYSEFFTAFSVEYARRFEGLSLEDASAKVVEERGMTDSLVQKRWKHRHKEAKGSLNLLQAVLEGMGIPRPTMPRKKKRQP